MANNKIDQKNLWRIYGIFFAIILVLGSALVGMTILSKKSWNEGLKASISDTLRSKQPDVWIVGNNIPLNSPFSTSASLYELRNRDSAEKYYVIILRIPTIYGHIPAVYTYNKTKGTEFIGYSNVQGRIKKILDDNSTDLNLNYWLDRIPAIIAKAEEGAGK